MVAGLAAYGDFEDALRQGTNLPPPAQIALVRVLEPDPIDDRKTRFDDPLVAMDYDERSDELLDVSELWSSSIDVDSVRVGGKWRGL